MGVIIKMGVNSQAVFTLYSILFVPLGVYTFSDGAGRDACSTFEPEHLIGPNRVKAQTDASPFSIVVSNDSYNTGSKIGVFLKGDSHDFRGFLLQARLVQGDHVFGSWDISGDNAWGTKLKQCFVYGDSVTHSKRQSRRNLSLMWNAPASKNKFSGDIYFVATFVETYTTFWKKIRSEHIKYVEPTTPPPSTTSTLPPTTTTMPITTTTTLATTTLERTTTEPTTTEPTTTTAEPTTTTEPTTTATETTTTEPITTEPTTTEPTTTESTTTEPTTTEPTTTESTTTEQTTTESTTTDPTITAPTTTEPAVTEPPPPPTTELSSTITDPATTSRQTTSIAGKPTTNESPILLTTITSMIETSTTVTTKPTTEPAIINTQSASSVAKQTSPLYEQTSTMADKPATSAELQTSSAPPLVHSSKYQASFTIVKGVQFKTELLNKKTIAYQALRLQIAELLLKAFSTAFQSLEFQNITFRSNGTGVEVSYDLKVTDTKEQGPDDMKKLFNKYIAQEPSKFVVNPHLTRFQELKQIDDVGTSRPTCTTQQRAQCHEYAECIANGRTFTCKCTGNYDGDGFNCSIDISKDPTLIIVIVVASLLFVVVLVIVIVTCVCHKREKKTNKPPSVALQSQGAGIYHNLMYEESTSKL